MVKCLNDGGTLVTKFSIIDKDGKPATRKCHKFGKPDSPEYRRREFVGEATQQVYIRLICPVCTTRPLGSGPRGLLTEEECDEFEKNAAKYFKWKAGNKERKIRNEIEKEKNDIINGEILKNIGDANRARLLDPDDREELAKPVRESKAAELEKAENDILKSYEKQKPYREAVNKIRGERSEKKKTKGFIKELATPTKTYTDYLKTVLTPIYWSVAGLVISALTGNAGFFFAALCFGLSSMVPGPEVLGDIKAKADRIKAEYKTKIEKARADGENDEFIRNLIEEMKAEVELEKLAAENNAAGNVVNWGKIKIPIGQARALVAVKQFLRGTGFLIMVISLLLASSIIPLAGLAGLILGFVGYFIGFNPEREPDKK